MSSFFKAKPFIIAGPCSAETREQVLETAAQLVGLNFHLFRAGVWKPRTRPGNFEGNGEIALQWLQEVKQLYNFKVTTEVAETSNVEAILKYNIDVVWIGARTVVNPFQIQNLADSLKGVSIPVMVKNPVNPDIDLWLGAIERFEKAGITNIAAIHRGFSGYSSASGYRNQPNWLIPIELKRRRPDLPVFCDPSHIAGKRSFVHDISQKALDLHFDGLMIETHSNPKEAWSDSAQQITPAQLKEMINKLCFRNEFSEDITGMVKLESLRQTIDSLDTEIIDLIAKRMELSEEIGEIKREGNMTVYQPARWREIVDTCTDSALKHLISKEFILDIYEKIHQESIRIQLAILAKDTDSEIKK